MQWVSIALVLAVCGVANARLPHSQQRHESVATREVAATHEGASAQDGKVVVLILLKTNEVYHEGENVEFLQTVKKRFSTYALINGVDRELMKPTEYNDGGLLALRIEFIARLAHCPALKNFVKWAIGDLLTITEADFKCGDAPIVLISKD